MNLANLITIGRFLLVPLIVSMILAREWTLAFLLFAVAGVSDAVDGFIAKRFGMTTELGATIDPLADKILLISIYVTLAVIGVLPQWLAILVVFRDLMIVSAVLVAWFLDKPIEIRPLLVSKATTAAQIGLATLALAAQAFDVDPGRLLNAAVLGTALLTLASAAAYLALWLRHMQV